MQKISFKLKQIVVGGLALSFIIQHNYWLKKRPSSLAKQMVNLKLSFVVAEPTCVGQCFRPSLFLECDQMDRLFNQFLVNYNNDYLPKYYIQTAKVNLKFCHMLILETIFNQRRNRSSYLLF